MLLDPLQELQGLRLSGDLARRRALFGRPDGASDRLAASKNPPVLRGLRLAGLRWAVVRR